MNNHYVIELTQQWCHQATAIGTPVKQLARKYRDILIHHLSYQHTQRHLILLLCMLLVANRGKCLQTSRYLSSCQVDTFRQLSTPSLQQNKGTKLFNISVISNEQNNSPDSLLYKRLLTTQDDTKCSVIIK